MVVGICLRRTWAIFILVAAGVLFGQTASALAASPVFLDGVSAARTADPSDSHPSGVTKGAAIHDYSFLINLDNTGDPSSPSADCHPATNPDPLLLSCGWTSIRSIPGSAPIVAQGGEQDLDADTSLALAPGKYLLSLTADGYAIDGVHFTVPAGGAPVHVVAQMQPADLPLATLRVQVFNDTASANGQWDEPGEDPSLNGGMAGFQAHLADVLGEVTTDWYGNPLCTQYRQAIWNAATSTWVATTRADPFKGPYLPSASQLHVRTPVGSPQIRVIGGRCLSNAAGEIEVGNLGPNRYAVTTVRPATGSWSDAVRTTTLEGAHDWDTWVPAGATGYDTEFLRAGEPTPWTEAGFVHAGTNRTNTTRYSGEIKGRVVAAEVAVPQVGGLPYNGSQYGQANGAKPIGPVNKPWIVISDLNGNNDQVIAVQRGNADGTFDVKGLVPSDYSVTIFDDEQDYLLDSWNITVGTSAAKPNGLTVDMGTPQLVGWFTDIHGTVFTDRNENGVQDPGETGIPGFVLAIKTRNNALMDQGSTTATTDLAGHYDFHEAYPLGLGNVLEAYTDRFYTTGLTYQATNQPDETTLPGAGVDINFLPIIGLSGRVDWGVKPYAAGTNGGIVGTVSYDSTRNETDPVEAAVEDYQPGIPDLKVNLFAPVSDGNGGYVREDDGSYRLGALLNQYTTEQWQRMKNCVARNIDGVPIVQGFTPSVPADGSEVACVEAPASGLQFSGDDPLGTGNPDANLFSSVDGNYGFGDGCQSGSPYDPESGTCADGSDPTALTTGDYLVKIEVPDNPAGGGLMYEVTKEEDVNVFTGDSYSPQVPPPPCAGALDTVDVAGVGLDGDYANTFHGVPVPDVPVDNPSFADAGGSPFEGQARPLCDVRLVTVQDRKSIAPTFNFFTPVPIPGRYWGLINDDLNLQLDPTSMNYGEVAGIPHVPVTIYDFSDRPIDTVHSDGNGFFEALEPSTSTYNCPLPAGPCPGVYRMVGNDPNGIDPQTGAYVRNADHNSAFNTISANFQVWPGLMLPADLALSQSGVSTQTPGSTDLKLVECKLPVAQPQIFAVSKPWGPRAGFTFHVAGVGFGATRGTASVTLDGTTLTTSAATWGDRGIDVTVPSGFALGAHQLAIKASNGLSAVNAITIHVTGTLGGTTYPTNGSILTVNRPASVSGSDVKADFRTIQDALEAAAGNATYRSGALIVVFPGAIKQPIAHSGDNPNTPYAQLPADPYNLDGAYYENIVIHSPVKLQGVGPGGIYADGGSVPGTAIDGSAFQPDANTGSYWTNLVAGLNVATNVGAPERYEGQTVYVVAPSRTTFVNASFKAAIDGLEIRGGATVNPGAPAAGGAPILSQGGGVFVDGYSDALRITNNLIDNNDGAYAGGIRVGTPEIAQNHNYGLRIAFNRIFSNGGANLAGGVGLFQGTNGYQVDHNDVCGNFSAEYGGAISHYGLSGLNGSTNDRVDHNRIYLNRSYDEGGGVTIAGELPANPDTLTTGSGAVDVFDNVLESNLANDDGGALRLLMVDGAAGSSGVNAYRINIYNNSLVDNISTHEGGGIAIDDATNVTFDNNTVVRNITTATAATSNGQPAPAGLSTSVNSALLQNRLAASAPKFSRPIMFNNVFWDNRAGSYTPAGIQGIGLTGDSGKVRMWDFGIFDQTNQPVANRLHVTSTVYDSCTSATSNCTSSDAGSIDASSGTNVLTAAPLAGNPLHFVNPFSVGIVIMPWRNQPQFIGNYIVAADLPPGAAGDYHVAAGASPIVGAGRQTSSGATPTIAKPGQDIDDQNRPATGNVDAGSDQRVP